MKTKQEMIDDFVALATRYNELFEELEDNLDPYERNFGRVDIKMYLAKFEESKKCYIGACSNTLLQKINELKLSKEKI